MLCVVENRHLLFLNWAIPGLFFFIFVFSIQLIVHTNFANDWIRTTNLWCWKRPLYQLHHNHFPIFTFFLSFHISIAKDTQFGPKNVNDSRTLTCVNLSARVMDDDGDGQSEKLKQRILTLA